jgi:hypothetical protein
MGLETKKTPRHTVMDGADRPHPAIIVCTYN